MLNQAKNDMMGKKKSWAMKKTVEELIIVLFILKKTVEEFKNMKQRKIRSRDE